MALRRLLLEKELREKRSSLEELRKTDFKKREAGLEAAIKEAKTEEERAAVESEIQVFEEDKEKFQADEQALETKIREIESEISGMDDAEKETEEKREEEKKEMKTRALDSASMDKRERIMNAPETKDFLERVRTAMSEKRAITGAGLTIPTVMLDLIRENIFRYSKLINRVRPARTSREPCPKRYGRRCAES